jgi:hypothetical protein
MLANLERIREVGLPIYLEEQEERRTLVEHLIEDFNEGRSMSFFCVASALMPPEVVRNAIESAERKLAAERVERSEIKTRAKTIKATIQELAMDLDIDLRLRKGKKGK